jgi:hypothetical protein
MSRLVRPEGLVIADDVGMPAVRLAVAYFQTNMGCQVLVPGDGSELWEPIDAASFLRSPARLAALRLPPRRERAAWDAFAPFGVEDVSGRDGLQAVRRAVLRRVAGVFKRGH